MTKRRTHHKRTSGMGKRSHHAKQRRSKSHRARSHTGKKTTKRAHHRRGGKHHHTPTNENANQSAIANTV